MVSGRTACFPVRMDYERTVPSEFHGHFSQILRPSGIRQIHEVRVLVTVFRIGDNVVTKDFATINSLQ